MASLEPDRSFEVLKDLLEGRLTHEEVFERDEEIGALIDLIETRCKEVHRIAERLETVTCRPTQRPSGIL